MASEVMLDWSSLVVIERGKKMTARTVGAYEAKTHLSELLDDVARGETITITKHGVPVARIVPIADTHRMTVDEAVTSLREHRKGVTLGGVTLRELRDEGRR